MSRFNTQNKKLKNNKKKKKNQAIPVLTHCNSGHHLECYCQHCSAQTWKCPTADFLLDVSFDWELGIAKIKKKYPLDHLCSGELTAEATRGGARGPGCIFREINQLYNEVQPQQLELEHLKSGVTLTNPELPNERHEVLTEHHGRDFPCSQPQK